MSMDLLWAGDFPKSKYVGPVSGFTIPWPGDFPRLSPLTSFTMLWAGDFPSLNVFAHSQILQYFEQVTFQVYTRQSTHKLYNVPANIYRLNI
jgi:hypothetical protein